MDYKKIFKNDWYHTLDVIINTEEFKNHMDWLQTEYKTKTVYPASTKIFRAFNKCEPNNLQVVWLGLDPYINGEATGLSFGVPPETVKFPPTLRIIENEYITDLGRDDLDLSFETYSKHILFLNTALTVLKGETKSHWQQWQFFTEAVISIINNEHRNVLFVLLGKEAENYAKFIDTKNHTILSLPHPMAEVYKPGIGFKNSRLFTKINEHAFKYFGNHLF